MKKSSAYILSPKIALRSWERIPYAYIVRQKERPQSLTAQEFQVLLRCDGSTELEDSPTLASLVERGLAVPCEPGQRSLDDWQRHVRCPNRVMPWIALEITGRCNYNCLHCFNATDNERLQTELTLEQIQAILDDAQRAGVTSVLLTGGEPLVHRDFQGIVEAVYSRNMIVHEVNTNGRFLTQRVLDLLGSHGHKPEMKISFDGLGFHDWMRDHRGAEEETLRAIRLCLDNGFPVRVQMNVNRKNRQSVMPTLEMLDELGVGRARVILTTASSRWEMNAHGQTMTMEEYVECAIQTFAAYAQGDHSMEVNFWQIGTLRPKSRSYSFEAVKYNSQTFKGSRPCCQTVNGMVAIASDGRVYPCLQCSGWFNARDIFLGNVLEEGLLPLMQGGAYCELAHKTVADRLENQAQNPGRYPCECTSCEWLTWCGGGCPALATLLSADHNYLAPDPTSCAFFHGGWARRFEEALPGWTNLSPLI